MLLPLRVHSPLSGQQISLNFLKYRTVFAFQSYRSPEFQARNPNAIEWYDKIIRGRSS
jgi:hypothetical protein